MPRQKQTVPFGSSSVYYTRPFHELAGGRHMNDLEQEGWRRHRKLLKKAEGFPEDEIPKELAHAILLAEQEAKRRKSAFDVANSLKKAVIANADYAEKLELENARLRAQLDAKNGITPPESDYVPLTMYSLESEYEFGIKYLGKTVLDIILEDANYLQSNWELKNQFDLDEKAQKVLSQFVK